MKITIKVEGMHCTSCELLLDDVLEELSGVDRAEADSIVGQVQVWYNPDQVRPQDITECIKAQGYKPESIDS